MRTIKNRTYADKTRGSFAIKRSWRIVRESMDRERSKQWNQQSNVVKAVFKGMGHEPEISHARKFLQEGKEYIVEGADMGPFMTYIKLEGIESEFNSVMFDVNYAELKRL